MNKCHEHAAQALCRSRKADGVQCDAPEEGACRECEVQAEVAFAQVPTLECFVCHARALPGLAYRGRPVCGHCSPNALSGEMLRMNIQIDPTIETEAQAAGGEKGGAYLDSIKTYDLGRLTAEQWAKFLAVTFEGYSDFMRAKAKETPPF